MKDHIFRSYIEGLRRKAREAEAARNTRTADARGRLAPIITLLIQEYGARRIVLFGSLAGGGFHENSDIDLLVEGADPKRWFEADARVAALAAPFEIDLVPAETAHRLLLEHAEREGKVLYDDH